MTATLQSINLNTLWVSQRLRRCHPNLW